MANRFELPIAAAAYHKKLNQSSKDEMIAEKAGGDMTFYWLCAQLGMVYNKQVKLPKNEIVDYFVKSLKPYESLIRGMLLACHFRDLKIKQDGIQDELTKILSSRESKLSSEGMDKMDLYAGGGFQIIQDKKIRPDDGWDNFMLWYHKEISKKTNTFSYEI